MFQIYLKYQFKINTLLNSFELFDYYLYNEKQKITYKELHLLAVACLFIETKMNEIFPL